LDIKEDEKGGEKTKIKEKGEKKRERPNLPHMEIQWAFFIYTLLVIILFILLVWSGIRGRSALVISLVVGLLVLSIICPFSSIEKILLQNNPWLKAYAFVYISTVLISLCYIILVGWNDRVADSSLQECFMSEQSPFSHTPIDSSFVK